MNLISSYKALRYGFGVLYGEAEYSKIYELYYNLGLQLTSVSNDEALVIKSLVIVPSITLQVGFGKHNLYNIENETFKSDKFNNLEEESFMDDYVVLKGNFGLDFIVNQNIGFNIFIQQQFTMEESLTFGTGVSVNF